MIHSFIGCGRQHDVLCISVDSETHLVQFVDADEEVVVHQGIVHSGQIVCQVLFRNSVLDSAVV